jgi:hypothetical protein
VPDTGSNRRRRPFQGPLPMTQVAWDQRTRWIQKTLEQRRFRIVWDHLGWFLPQVISRIVPADK